MKKKEETKKVNIDKTPRLMFPKKNFDPSLTESIMSEFKKNGILSIKDLCMIKEGELYLFKSFNNVSVEVLKRELSEYGLSLGMTKEKLNDYKKGILNVSVSTTHNGYQLVTIKDGHSHEHLYFTLIDLLKGFMYHVGLEELNAIDKNEIDFFIDASQKWNDQKECILDNIKKEKDINSLSEKVKILTSENESQKKYYDRETNKLKEKHAKDIKEIQENLNAKIRESESALIESKYEMTKDHNQEISDLKASFDVKLNQVNELHKKQVEELKEQMEKLKPKSKRKSCKKESPAMANAT